MEILYFIGSSLGIGSVIYLIVKHLLKKKKYNQEVNSLIINNESTEKKVELEISQEIRDLYKNIVSDLKAIVDEHKNENVLLSERLRREAEDCDKHIKKLQEEVKNIKEKLSKNTKDIQNAYKRCVNNCFSDNGVHVKSND